MQAIKASILNAPLKMQRPLMGSLKSNYHFNPLIAQFTNLLMRDGMKQRALKHVIGAMQFIESNSTADPFSVLESAIRNAQPIVGLKKKKLRNKIELQPRSFQEKQGTRLAIVWIVKESAKRKEKTFAERLGAEILAASKNESGAIKRKMQLHDDATKARSTLNRLLRMVQQSDRNQ